MPFKFLVIPRASRSSVLSSSAMNFEASFNKGPSKLTSTTSEAFFERGSRFLMSSLGFCPKAGALKAASNIAPDNIKLGLIRILAGVTFIKFLLAAVAEQFVTGGLKLPRGQCLEPFCERRLVSHWRSAELV